MTVATIISKTDLARRTRQIVNQARRGGAVIVESYGEEQVATWMRRTTAVCGPWQRSTPGRRSHHRPPTTLSRRVASTPTRCREPSSQPKGMHKRRGIVC